MALAACTRVDSCFAPWFVPSLGVSLQLAQLEVHLCHHLEQLGTGRMHKPQDSVSFFIGQDKLHHQLMVNIKVLLETVPIILCL